MPTCGRERTTAAGAIRPFDPIGDYDSHADGKPRADGTRSLLTAPGIELPEGSPDDPPGGATVQSLGDRKNETVLRRIREDGVQTYEGSARYVPAVRAGLRRAAASSSTNCTDALVAAGIEDLEERFDGLTGEREHLAGKLTPDMFLAAARTLGVAPDEAAVFGDALARVSAGRAGGFGFVVAVGRAGQASELEAYGADIVVADLAELLEAA